MKKRFFPVLIMLCSMALLAQSLFVYHDIYRKEHTPPSDLVPVLPTPPPVEEDPDAGRPDNPVDFATLQEQYPEAVAWITVPDTAINYPIMQSGPDTQEDYYLTHDQDGKSTKSGSIYIQKYNKANFADPNTIIYGHNMANGSMFRAIHRFRKQDFFKEHDTLYIYLPGHVLTYRIYSVFIHSTQHILAAYDHDTEKGFQKFINKTLKPTSSVRQVREGVIPTTDDRIVTLSTCTNTSDGDGRLLLVAVLIDDTETKKP